MRINEKLDGILDTATKVRIVRLFSSRTADFMAGGREVARQIGVSAPAAHAALKELCDRGILSRRIAGRQHLYSMDRGSRLVKDILMPAFKKETSAKKDIEAFILKAIKSLGLSNKIESALIYGSIEKGEDSEHSDCDLALVVRDPQAAAKAEDAFHGSVCHDFKKYFGISLDVYVKTRRDFAEMLRKKKPPVSSMIGSSRVIYGKEMPGL